MFIDRLFKLGAAAVVALGLSVSSASAVTVISDGDTVMTGAGLETLFIGEVNAFGGPGTFEVTFEANREASADAMATIGPIVASTFSGLTLSWLNAADNSVLATTPITPVETTLATIFSDPTTLDQVLQVSWTDSLAGAGFDIEVSVAPVPLPFAGALLVTGIAGLALLRRRQSAV